VEEAVRQVVRERAGQNCEYCRLSQHDALSFRFHIEHVRPRQHGGTDHPDNLALACPNCNWSKGPNITAVDPQTDTVVPIFNPRTDTWDDHFSVQGAEIRGRTLIGRATVRLLRFNAPDRLEIRLAVTVQKKPKAT
jgi:hypothetical protein